MEKVGTLMTRGVLIDVAGLKGVETLPDAYEDAYEITGQDLQDAQKRQNLTCCSARTIGRWRWRPIPIPGFRWRCTRWRSS